MELLIALLVAAVVVALISRNRNPLKVCPTCKGAGVLRSGVWSKRFRPCTRCGRKGEISAR
ncbi:hypothetical protein [Nonomuraea sp. NEAU-A123]|uniref:hypothetical protein n=1 Tax=Nonomuraea sp. NEAU-A123 TaxID=2839649 RepID=UPI001BE3E9B8|nr:hypothetical protein [Nonomuraea sp. NEAU-A123]MBT2232202.1 hypothetical protein [Nonomuraea sp. NEAU-A123]